MSELLKTPKLTSSSKSLIFKPVTFLNNPRSNCVITSALEFEGNFDSTKVSCQIEELYLETNKEYISCY